MPKISGDRLLAGRYEVGELIGRGGMAEVHAGWDARLGREVAVKILRTELARDASFVQRFRREAQAAASLDHPAIVAIFDSGEKLLTQAGGAELAVPFMVMERVHGRTLREVLAAEGPFSPHHAADVMAATLDALGFSHSAGIIHRDIKPANVMVADNTVADNTVVHSTVAGSGAGVKVMDFGIARAIADAAATMTNTSVVIGTAQYLSPEQARGQEVDQRSDLYAAGCVLFELLTGRAPFVADSPIAIAYQHVGEAAPPPSSLRPGIPADLDAVVLHALAKDPDERYQSAAEMAADLRAVLAGRPVQLSAAERAKDADGTSGANRTGHSGESSAQGAAGAQGAARAHGAPGAPATIADRDADTGPQPPVTEGRSRQPRWLVLTLIALLTTLLGAALYQRNVIDRTVAVPTITGSTRAQAIAALTDHELVPTVVSVADKAAVGTVVGQDPGGGAERPAGSTVTLQVSAGPRAVTIPDVSNYDQVSARQRLSDLGLESAEVKLVDSFQVVAGNVVGTTPKVGSTVPEGTSITLLVSNGRIKVPDVVGKSEDDARTALQAVGLKIQARYVYSWKQLGTVLAQSNVGEAVSVGSQISLTVARSRPPQPATVTKTFTSTPRSTTTPKPTGPDQVDPSPSPHSTNPPAPTSKATGTPAPAPTGTPAPSAP